jgi:hypothetical protein
VDAFQRVSKQQTAKLLLRLYDGFEFQLSRNDQSKCRSIEQQSHIETAGCS